MTTNRDRHRPLPPLAEAGLVSFLVAGWNEAEHLGPLVASYRALSWPHTELVLVLGGDDASFELGLSFADADLRVLRQERGDGKQGALRRGLAVARGTSVFFTDADCVLDDGAVSRMLRALGDEAEEVVTGTLRPLRSQRLTPLVVHQWATSAYLAARSGDYVSGLLGANCAVSRQALAAVDAFADRAPTGTDYNLAKKLLAAGYRIRYLRDCAVETHLPETAGAYLRQQSRWLRNVVLHGLRYGSNGEVRSALLSMATGVFFVTQPLLLLRAGRVQRALLLAPLAYAFIARVRRLHSVRRRLDPTIGLRHYACIPAFMALDFAAWARAAFDLLLPARRRRW